MPDNIPFYVVNEPYELIYRNESTEYPVGAHTHNAAEIYLTLSDLPDVLLNDKVLSVTKGSLILIPPFCVHQLYHEKNIVYERYILNIGIDWLDNVLGADCDFTECLRHSDRPIILTLDEKQLSLLTESMHKSAAHLNARNIRSTAEFFSMLEILESVINSARMNISNHTVSISKSQKTVNNIIAFINDHLEENLSLADISSHFFLNRDYLSRLFMRHTHISIGRYILIQKISKAQQYLSMGMTVSQVSEKMGFSSYAYFFKVFKKMTGISPSQYRNDFLK